MSIEPLESIPILRGYHCFKRVFFFFIIFFLIPIELNRLLMRLVWPSDLIFLYYNIFLYVIDNCFLSKHTTYRISRSCITSIILARPALCVRKGRLQLAYNKMRKVFEIQCGIGIITKGVDVSKEDAIRSQVPCSGQSNHSNNYIGTTNEGHTNCHLFFFF